MPVQIESNDGMFAAAMSALSQKRADETNNKRIEAQLQMEHDREDARMKLAEQNNKYTVDRMAQAEENKARIASAHDIALQTRAETMAMAGKKEKYNEAYESGKRLATELQLERANFKPTKNQPEFDMFTSYKSMVEGLKDRFPNSDPSYYGGIQAGLMDAIGPELAPKLATDMAKTVGNPTASAAARLTKSNPSVSTLETTMNRQNKQGKTTPGMKATMQDIQNATATEQSMGYKIGQILTSLPQIPGKVASGMEKLYLNSIAKPAENISAGMGIPTTAGGDEEDEE